MKAIRGKRLFCRGILLAVIVSALRIRPPRYTRRKAGLRRCEGRIARRSPFRLHRGVPDEMDAGRSIKSAPVKALGGDHLGWRRSGTAQALQLECLARKDRAPGERQRSRGACRCGLAALAALRPAQGSQGRRCEDREGDRRRPRRAIYSRAHCRGFPPGVGSGVYHLYFGASEPPFPPPSDEWANIAGAAVSPVKAVSERIEARTALDSFWPMEVPALAAETAALLDRFPGGAIPGVSRGPREAGFDAVRYPPRSGRSAIPPPLLFFAPIKASTGCFRSASGPPARDLATWRSYAAVSGPFPGMPPFPLNGSSA